MSSDRNQVSLRASKLRNELRQPGNELIHAPKRQHEVSIAGYVERRHGDARSSKRREKFPVAVDIAVPVQPSAKPGAREFPCEELDVGLGEPKRQGRRVHAAAEETTAPGTMPTVSGLTIDASPRGASPEAEYRRRRSVMRTSRSNSASATPGVWK